MTSHSPQAEAAALIAEARQEVDRAAESATPNQAERIRAGRADDTRLALIVQLTDALEAASDPLPWVSETGYRTSVQAWHPIHGLSTYSPRVIREASPVEVTEAMVEAAARAMWNLRARPNDPAWGSALDWGVREEYRKDARAALRAALGVVEPKPAPETPDLQEES